MRTVPGSLALAFLVLCCPAAAQQGGEALTLLRLNGGGPSDRVGEAVALAGDVDGDGTSDIIIGAEFANSFGHMRNGMVLVYSGANGALLHQFHGNADFQKFGTSVASAGDINADGYDDIIVGSPEASPPGLNVAGQIDIFSGFDGSNLLHIDGTVDSGFFGRSVASCGDIDGDTTPDFIVGESGFNNEAGRAHVYSGLSGTTIHVIDGVVGDLCGFSTSGAGDVDGDGTLDFAIGSPYASVAGFNENGSAIIYSGASGNALLQFEGNDHDISFGYSVSGGFDVNDDNIPDLIVGAPKAKNLAGASAAGTAVVFSGSNGQLLHQG